MKFKLRTYQKEGIEACLEVLKSTSKKSDYLVVSPTGGGKSIYVAETVKRLKEPILIIQPTKELLLQNYLKFTLAGGKASICCSSLKTKTKNKIDYTELEDGSLVECNKVSKITYATPGSVKKHLNKLKLLGVKKAIIDEAHLSTKKGSVLRNFFKDLGITHVVGLTATPLFLEGGLNGAVLKMMNRTRSKLFRDIKHVTQIKELVDNKFWSPLNYKIVKTDGSLLEENSNGSDYTVQSQQDFYKGNKLEEKILEEISNMEKAGRKSILVFLPTIEEAESLAKKYKKGAVVHSKLNPKVRDKVVRDFKTFKIKVVFNVNVLSVGFDHPELDAIITARSTASIALFYQQIGRGVRIHPDKEDCNVTDFSGNVERFGKVEDLTFENIPLYGWGLFNGKDQLLTAYPIKAKNRPTKTSLKEKGLKEARRKSSKSNPQFTFGLFKGRRILDIAYSKDAQRLKSYCAWFWDRYKRGKWDGKVSTPLLESIKDFLQVEDTKYPF